MARPTPHDQLAAAISGILDEYANDVTVSMKDAVKKVTKEGTKALKRASAQEFGNGDYAKSWRFVYDADNIGASGVIYSSKPGLPHLLENGHLLRNGRFWPGKPHIKPVEEQIVEDFEEEVIKNI